MPLFVNTVTFLGYPAHDSDVPANACEANPKANTRPSTARMRCTVFLSTCMNIFISFSGEGGGDKDRRSSSPKLETGLRSDYSLVQARIMKNDFPMAGV